MRTPHPVIVDGIYYPAIVRASQEVGIRAETLYNYLARGMTTCKGHSIQDGRGKTLGHLMPKPGVPVAPVPRRPGALLPQLCTHRLGRGGIG